MLTAEADALDWISQTYATNPIATLLGAKPLACDPSAGRITIAFQAQPEFCNLLGTVQGGMLAAMLDLVMSFAALCTMGGPGFVVPTIDMNTHFLSPARPGRIDGDGERPADEVAAGALTGLSKHAAGREHRHHRGGHRRARGLGRAAPGRHR